MLYIINALARPWCTGGCAGEGTCVPVCICTMYILYISSMPSVRGRGWTWRYRFQVHMYVWVLSREWAHTIWGDNVGSIVGPIAAALPPGITWLPPSKPPPQRTGKYRCCQGAQHPGAFAFKYHGELLAVDRSALSQLPVLSKKSDDCVVESALAVTSADLRY